MTESGVNYGAEMQQKNGRSNSQSNVVRIKAYFVEKFYFPRKKKLILKLNLKIKKKKKPINYSNLLSNHQFTHFLSERTKNIIPKVKKSKS